MYVFAFPVKARLPSRSGTCPSTTFYVPCWKRSFSLDILVTVGTELSSGCMSKLINIREGCARVEAWNVPIAWASHTPLALPKGKCVAKEDLAQIIRHSLAAFVPISERYP